MPLYKNVGGQKLPVYAYFSSTNTPATGDANNIRCYLSKDGGAGALLADTNPTSITNQSGMYVFDLSQSETSGDLLIFYPYSSTAGVVLDKYGIYTTPGTNLGINSNITQWTGVVVDSLLDVQTLLNDFPGVNLTATGVPTISGVSVTAPTGIDSSQLLNATIYNATENREHTITRITAVVGSNPHLSLTVFPYFESTPISGDILKVGPQYLTSL